MCYARDIMDLRERPSNLSMRRFWGKLGEEKQKVETAHPRQKLKSPLPYPQRKDLCIG